MNSYARFHSVWVAVEAGIYGRPVFSIDVERAYRRYLKVMNEEPLP